MHILFAMFTMFTVYRPILYFFLVVIYKHILILRYRKSLICSRTTVNKTHMAYDFELFTMEKPSGTNEQSKIWFVKMQKISPSLTFVYREPPKSLRHQPSTVRPFAFWNLLTAASVSPPKSPSAPYRGRHFSHASNRAWRCRTSSPLSPFESNVRGFCGTSGLIGAPYSCAAHVREPMMPSTASACAFWNRRVHSSVSEPNAESAPPLREGHLHSIP